MTGDAPSVADYAQRLTHLTASGADALRFRPALSWSDAELQEKRQLAKDAADRGGVQWIDSRLTRATWHHCAEAQVDEAIRNQDVGRCMASVHTLPMLQRVVDAGFAAAVISPILASRHGRAVWPLSETGALAGQIPVFWLGGCESHHVSLAVHCGFQGISMLGSWWDVER